MKIKNLAFLIVISFFFNLNAGEKSAFDSFGGKDNFFSSMDQTFQTPQINAADFSKSPNMKPALDISLKLPFIELNKRLASINPQLLKPSYSGASLLTKKGENLAFENAIINYNGIEVEPSFFLKPYFIAKNKIAVKIEKVEMDISFGPSKSFAQIDKNSVMEMAVNGIMSSVMTAMDGALSKNKVPLKAKDIISFSYDRISWTIFIDINPSFISPLMPGLVSSLNLSSFGFDEKGFFLKAGYNSELIAVNPSFNLAVSDGLITAFVKKYATNADMDLTPADYDGGFKFREDGLVELGARAKVDSLPFNPNVYFKAYFRLSMPAENTMRIRIEKIDVDKVYGMGVLGSIANWFEGKITKSAIEAIASNPELNKAMKARKIDEKTIEINFSKAAFLPSFSQGVSIKAVKISKGLAYLSFEF